jgi:hypothetical protein
MVHVLLLQSLTTDDTDFHRFVSTACVNPNKKNLRESANGAGGVSDIEGKTATGSGERVGKPMANAQ